MAATPSQPKHSAEALVAKAHEFLQRAELSMAAGFLQRALEVSPTSTEVMDKLAAVLLEVGAVDAALPWLQRSIQLAPESGHEKYLYLGQVQQGHEAVASFRRGIALLQLTKAKLDNSGDFSAGASVAQSICDAYCSIVEVYMSDLCFETDAETQCDSAIAAALNACPTSISAYQTLANIRLCQNNKKEAGRAMKKVVQLLSRCTDETMPSYELRAGSVKLLIELKQPQVALQLGTRLLGEDDENAEVWFISGIAARDLVLTLLSRIAKNGGSKAAAAAADGDNGASSTLAEAENVGLTAEQYLTRGYAMLKKVQTETLKAGEGPDVSPQLAMTEEALRSVATCRARVAAVAEGKADPGLPCS